MGTFPEHAPERATSLAERLTEELARRSRRRSLEQKSHAGRISDDLVAMGGEAVPALIGRLDSLGEIGCTTLARIGPTAFSALVEALRAGPARRRCLAARALELTGVAAAAGPLRCASFDRDPVVREAARHALDGLARTWVTAPSRRPRAGRGGAGARRPRRAGGVAAGARLARPLRRPVRGAHPRADRRAGGARRRCWSWRRPGAAPTARTGIPPSRTPPWRSPRSGRRPSAPCCTCSTTSKSFRTCAPGLVCVLGRMGEIAAPHLVAALEDDDPLRARGSPLPRWPAIAFVTAGRDDRRAGRPHARARRRARIPQATNGNTLAGMPPGRSSRGPDSDRRMKGVSRQRWVATWSCSSSSRSSWASPCRAGSRARSRATRRSPWAAA